MSNLVYPSIRGLQYPVKKTATYANLIQPSKSGVEVAVAMMANPIWLFELGYEYIEDGYLPQQSGFGVSDFHALLGFYMSRRGNFDDFLFVDTTDYMQLAAPLLLLEDLNGFFYSPLQRSIGGAVFGGVEDITDLLPAGYAPPLTSGGTAPAAPNPSPTVYENGVPHTTSFILNGPGLNIPGVGAFAGMWLQWNAEPTPPITADLGWYFRVRFDSQDGYDFDNFARNLWLTQKIDLRTKRKGPQI